MKRVPQILFFIFLKSTCFAQLLTYEDVIDSIGYWVDERVTNAMAGRQEIVEMPLVVRSLGWGCICPDHYIGVSPSVQEGPFIHPIVPKGFPKTDMYGHSLMVRGYFSGRIVEEDYRDESGEPAEWLYQLHEFVITKWKHNKLDYQIRAPYVIRLNK